MKKLNDCSTCLHDSFWIGGAAGRYCDPEETLKKAGTPMSDFGYPHSGELCPFYCRVPGSDDDKE
jgi:hypothetical protein